MSTDVQLYRSRSVPMVGSSSCFLLDPPDVETLSTDRLKNILAMIHAAIIHITDQLNQYLRRTFDLNEDIVAVSNILEQDGSIAPNVENKLVVSLVNIEKESTPAPLNDGNKNPGVKSVLGYPPVFLNIYLMFAGNFSSGNYPESLKFISNTVSFFQGNPVFNHENTPDLDERINQLVMNIENLDIHELSNLWSILSGKYVPSVLYKVRMVVVDSQDIRIQVPAITDPAVLVRGPS